MVNVPLRVQVNPSPVKPLRQEQSKLPTVLLHTPFSRSQVWESAKHSSMSVESEIEWPRISLQSHALVKVLTITASPILVE